MLIIDRLKLETKGIALQENEYEVYLLENGLVGATEYKPDSATNKKGIYATALSILESIANNPSSMKSYRLDDMTISDFHENLISRIDQLESKIRKLKTDEQLENQSNVFMLWGE